jgi:hypothetical protein
MNVNYQCWGNKHQGRNSYAGNFGQKQQGEPDRIKGVFDHLWGVKFDDVRDGNTQTLLLSELIVGGNCNVRGTHSYFEGPLFMQDYTPNDLTPDLTRWCAEPDRNQGPAPCVPGNGTLGGGILGNNLARVLHTARSFHPGGVGVALCDGSVHFVNETISLDVWKGLGTPSGKEVIPGDAF